MDPDDASYKKSVRNMSIVLAVIVITVFVALAVSPVLFPATSTFQTSTSYDSTFGFALHLEINTTAPLASGGVEVTGWLNSTSGGVVNVTSSDSWGMGPAGTLWTTACTQGWPIGVGIVQGHYTQDNISFARLYPIPLPSYQCPSGAPAPTSFLLEPQSSKALVALNGTPQYWVLRSSYVLDTAGLPPGAYTAVLADEWGDVVTTNFVVS